MDSLISVIVPIYNVEKYLQRCVDSIINQTYRNLEIILVNDGSPDNCPKMCDDYAKKDSRIKVVHKENGGLSDARNVGMEVATGEYISFIDSDDWIELNMIELLYNNLIETDSDISSGGIRMVWEGSASSRLLMSINEDDLFVFNSSEEALRELIEGNKVVQTVWNKLYKTLVLRDVIFPVGKINEDEYWSWQVFAKAKRVVSIGFPVYNYLQRGGSIMRSGKYNPFYVIEANSIRYNYVLDNFPNLVDLCCEKGLYNCLYQAQRSKLLLSKKKYNNYIKKIRQEVKVYKPRKSFLGTLSFKKKIRLLSIYYCFGIVCGIQNILGIGNESNI